METINTLGRRKASIARIYMTKGKGKITVNGRELADYFPTEILRQRVNRPFVVLEQKNEYDIKANLSGGGITGQADALKLAISRALVEVDAENKPALKHDGLMTRDPRMVERKKFGQKKARKKFQFSKR